MADPTLNLTFQQMQIRIADFLGIADRSGSALAVPTDAKNLELVKRLVNDGYRRFIAESEKWNFLNVPLTINFAAQLTGTITAKDATHVTIGGFAGTYANDFFNGFEFTIDNDSTTKSTYTVVDYVGATGQFQVAAVGADVAVGDTLLIAGANNVEGIAWRYYLPDDFYGIWRIPLTYAPNGPRVRIVEVTEEEIREMRAGQVTTGDPLYAAFRPINTVATTTSRRYEALFWPEPSSAIPVTGIYKRFPAALSANGDVSVAGFHHDGTILAAAFAAAEMYRHDKIGIHEQMYQAKLVTSKKLDAHATPRQNRPYGDMSDGTSPLRTSDQYRPASYDGVDLG